MASDNKYDRQIRLWGPHGQKILSSSSILLLGASASGSETLKNLILPGIQKFTIVDDAKVEKKDLGQNFFLTHDKIGQSRAQCMYENLIELNPDDVKGEFIESSVADYIKNEETAWNYDLVIVTDLDNDLCSLVSKRCRGAKKIPLVIIRQYGLIGYMKIDLDELCVAEQKLYQVVKQDLRLNQPFDKLIEYVNSYDLNKLSDKEEEQLAKHSHVPYVVVLLQGAAKWKAEHDGQMPKSFKEKEDFKLMIKGMAMDYSKELNFEEAIKACFQLLRPVDHGTVLEIFDNPKCEDKSVTEAFWVHSAALKKFYSKNKTLPIAGSIPDMTSHTDYYLGIQKVYVDQAENDFQEMNSYMKEIIQQRGLNVESYLESDLRIFCKNSSTLEVTKMKSFTDDLANFQLPEDFQYDLHDDDEICNRWFLACRVIEEFRQEKGYYAGMDTAKDNQAKYDEELANLQAKMDTYTEKITPGQKVDAKFLKEMMRFKDTKIHTISAFLGGVASQEIIKILIRQYTIFNNCLIYDAIHGKCKIFE